MSERAASTLEVARRIADALEAAGVEYAIGGSLAYSQYGVPRATNDIDLNVFVGRFGAPQLLAALRVAGCTFDGQAALDALASSNDFGATCEGHRVDVFPDFMPLHQSARDRAVRSPLLGRPAYFLSAEDIVLFKLMWHRPIDLVDIERLLAVWGAKLDRAYVHDWIARLFQEDDERRRTFDELDAEVSGRQRLR